MKEKLKRKAWKGST